MLDDSRDALYTAFVSTHYAKLVRAAARVVGRQDANDVVQDTLVKLYKDKSVNWATVPIGYVYTATVNMGRDQYKKAEKKYSVPTGDSHDMETGPARSHGPVGVGSELDSVLTDLDPQIRHVLICRFELGLSAEEIASAMHYSVGTVNSWIRDGREQLRVQLNRRPAGESS